MRGTSMNPQVARIAHDLPGMTTTETRTHGRMFNVQAGSTTSAKLVSLRMCMISALTVRTAYMKYILVQHYIMQSIHDLHV